MSSGHARSSARRSISAALAAACLAACSATTEIGGSASIQETASASVDFTTTRVLRVTVTLENLGAPVDLIWGNDCSGFGDAVSVRVRKHGTGAVVWDSDRLPNALVCPSAAHTRHLGTGETQALSFVAGMDAIVGDSLPSTTYDVTAAPRVVGAPRDTIAAGSVPLTNGFAVSAGTPLDGVWAGAASGVTVSLDLHWTADSVSGSGTWRTTGANDLGCGGGTLSGTGTVTLAARRSGDQVGGPMAFSNGWTPPFIGVLADATTLGAHFMSIDTGPCPITLIRQP